MYGSAVGDVHWYGEIICSGPRGRDRDRGLERLPRARGPEIKEGSLLNLDDAGDEDVLPMDRDGWTQNTHNYTEEAAYGYRSDRELTRYRHGP